MLNDIRNRMVLFCVLHTFSRFLSLCSCVRQNQSKFPLITCFLLAYMPQKRFMVSKKKRSVTQAPSPAAVVGCKPGDASCGAQSHQQGGIIQAAA